MKWIRRLFGRADTSWGVSWDFTTPPGKTTAGGLADGALWGLTKRQADEHYAERTQTLARRHHQAAVRGCVLMYRRLNGVLSIEHECHVGTADADA